MRILILIIWLLATLLSWCTSSQTSDEAYYDHDRDVKKDYHYEIEKLRNENDELRNENEDLRNEVDDLSP